MSEHETTDGRLQKIQALEGDYFEVESDRFNDESGWVVSVSAEDETDDSDSGSLVSMSPEQARQLAKALCETADYVEGLKKLRGEPV